MRTFFRWITIAMLHAAASAFASDRPGLPEHKSRSAVCAREGMAATSHPLATAAAIRVLQNGGNAADAAIAANAVLGVVEPMMCGLGGDLFAIVWDAKTRTLHGLNASGRSPSKASLALFREKGLSAIPTHGPLSWSVPGCVDGWERLRERFGTKPFGELLAPAIHYAEDGFPVTEMVSIFWKNAEPALLRVPTSAETFLPDGRAPGFAEIFRNPRLARSLRLIAQGGRDAYYRGPIAVEIVAYSNKVGGLFVQEDFSEHRSTWVEPVSTNYRGYDVWELPPNGQGIAALQMLNVLERYDLKSMGPQSAEALHLMIEAKKLAFEDRAAYYADPEKSKVPVARLISKEYAAERAKLISTDRANDRLEAGRANESETTYLTVVDRDLNCVSLIQSNYSGFGSGHVPGELGFALQNRGCLFALDPSHPNRLEPKKRPFHTIIPAFVTKEGKPWLSFGVMGGDIQPQGHVQILCNLIDWGMDAQAAGDAPRFVHSGSSDPTGGKARDGGLVRLESAIGPAVRRALEAKGHRIAPIDRSAFFGGYQGIRIDADRRVLMGGSESRFDGAAMGY